MKISFFYLSLITLIFSLSACSNDNPATEENTDDISTSVNTDNDDDESVNININSNDVQDALNQLSQQLQGGDENSDVKIMNFRDIKAIFPDRLLGIDRSELNGSSTNIAGFQMSEADATYEDGDRKIDIQVMDMSKMGIAALSQATWAQMDIDRESDDGYERTLDIDGDKAYEKWEEDRERGSLFLFYKGRYMVNIDAEGISMNQLKTIYDAFDLGDLDD